MRGGHCQDSLQSKPAHSAGTDRVPSACVRIHIEGSQVRLFSPRCELVWKLKHCVQGSGDQSQHPGPVPMRTSIQKVAKRLEGYTTSRSRREEKFWEL